MINNLLKIHRILAIRILLSFCIFNNCYSQNLNSSSLDNIWQTALLQHGYVAVPVEFAKDQNLLLVSVTFDNSNYLPFVIDTGSTHSYVDQSLVSQFNFKKGADIMLIAGVGDTHRRQATEVYIPYIHLGDFSSQDEIAYAQDYSFIIIDNHRVGGMLGLDYLNEHQAILDIKDHLLYLKNNNDDLEVTSYLPSMLLNDGYQSVTITPAPSGHQTIMAQINDSDPGAFLLDTGLPISLISQATANNLDLHISNNQIIEIGSGGSKFKVLLTSVNNITAATINWYPEKIGITDFKNIPVGIPLFGALGLDWMRANNAVIDVANNVIYIKNSD